MPAKDDDAYKRWKRRIPLLYDWFMQAPLTWPTLACRWGPKLNDHTYKWSQRVYLSEQVSEKGEFNKLCVYAADLCKPRVCAAETCCSWSETSQSPYLKLAKTIFHPGEVNKIRDLETHPEIVLTHTDAPELLLWNVEQQPDRLEEKEGKGKRSRKESVPNLKLTGHEQDAKFAMDTASAAPVVASGGDDGLVLTWNLEDQETAMASAGKTAPTLQAGLRLEGHTATVESVSFRYGSTQQLVSVGDDAQLLLWDARDGLQPTGRVEAAHGADVDIHCVHWSPADPNFIVSGASTGKLKVWDVRKLGGERCALQELEGVNEGETLQVEWSPSQRGVFASGGADQVVSVWDLNRTADDRGYRQQAGVPMELMFQHVGHRSQVVDFQWHADDAWMLMSVSDNSHLESGGGTLNVWRIISLITSSFDEAAAELEQYREYVIHGKRPLFSREQSEPAAASKRPAPAPQDDASRPEACAAEDQPGEAAELRKDAVDGETADGGATYADALPAADPDEDDGPTTVASVPDAEEAGG